MEIGDKLYCHSSLKNSVGDYLFTRDNYYIIDDTFTREPFESGVNCIILDSDIPGLNSFFSMIDKKKFTYYGDHFYTNKEHRKHKLNKLH